jgi:hypothetical protein
MESDGWLIEKDRLKQRVEEL